MGNNGELKVGGGGGSDDEKQNPPRTSVSV